MTYHARPVPESPIEHAMLDALRRIAIEWGYSPVSTWDEVKHRWGDYIVVRPQATIGKFRVDFLVEFQLDAAHLKIVVECDGHQFHERTKTQASNDRKRDRVLQKLGYEVYRFTGRDVHKNADDCARDVIEAVLSFQTKVVESTYGADNGAH